MKKHLFYLLFIVCFVTVSKAQQAAAIDPRYVNLPIYADLTAITSSITAPNPGMIVYNTATASSWYYNGTVWNNMLGGVATLTLPYVVSTATSGNLFSLTNTGTGGSGSFGISNPTNVQTALAARTNGTGRAAAFTHNNVTSTNYALSAVHVGLGRAADFAILNSASTADALNVSTSGVGRAINASNMSATAATISAENTTNLGTAIEISGGIKVAGTNKAAFRITSNASNIYLNQLIIPNTTLANNSNDMLFVTHVYGPGAASVYLNKSFGVYWNVNEWYIYLEDNSTMPLNVTFNVLVIKQ